MRWLRLYDDVLDDPKVQQLPPPLFKHWINLLCLASKTEPRGTLPCSDDVAFRLRLTSSATRTMLDQLFQRGLLDWDRAAERYTLHGWNNHAEVRAGRKRPHGAMVEAGSHAQRARPRVLRPQRQCQPPEPHQRSAGDGRSSVIRGE